MSRTDAYPVFIWYQILDLVEVIVQHVVCVLFDAEEINTSYGRQRFVYEFINDNDNTIMADPFSAVIIYICRLFLLLAHTLCFTFLHLTHKDEARGYTDSYKFIK